MEVWKSRVCAFLMACSMGAVFAAENFVTGQALLDGGAVKLSADELKSIIRVGVEVQTYAPGTGSYRLWTNDAGGTFIASRRGGTSESKSQGAGEWRVTDAGEYCVQIDWRTRKGAPDHTEKWCRVLWRYDGALYLAPGNLTGREDVRLSAARFR